MSRSARPLAYIALQACALTFIGLALGTRLGARLGARAELIAGMVLALLGLALIVSEASGRHFLRAPPPVAQPPV